MIHAAIAASFSFAGPEAVVMVPIVADRITWISENVGLYAAVVVLIGAVVLAFGLFKGTRKP